MSSTLRLPLCLHLRCCAPCPAPPSAAHATPGSSADDLHTIRRQRVSASHGASSCQAYTPCTHLQPVHGAHKRLLFAYRSIMLRHRSGCGGAAGRERCGPIFRPSPHKRGHLKLGDGSRTGVPRWPRVRLARMARVWDVGAALSEPKVGAQVWHVTRSMYWPPSPHGCAARRRSTRFAAWGST